MNIKQKTPSQWLWIVVIAVLTILLAVGLLWNNKSETAESAAQGEQEHAHQESEKAEKHRNAFQPKTVSLFREQRDNGFAFCDTAERFR